MVSRISACLLLVVFSLVVNSASAQPVTKAPLKPVAKAAPAKPVGMTNQDVVALTKAGFSEEFVIEQITRASEKVFDLSARGLVALKTSGVSERVIKVMAGSPEKPPAVEVPPAPQVSAAGQVESRPEQNSEAGADKDPPLRRLGGKITGLFKKKSTDQENAASDKAGETATATATATSTGAKCSVFVKAAETDGFANSELEDSAKDFMANLKRQNFGPANSEAGADVLLTIVKREKRLGEPTGSSGRTLSILRGSKGKNLEVADIWTTLSVKRDGKWVPGIKLSSNSCCMTWRAARDRILDLAAEWLKQNAPK